MKTPRQPRGRNQEGIPVPPADGAGVFLKPLAVMGLALLLPIQVYLVGSLWRFIQYARAFNEEWIPLEQAVADALYGAGLAIGVVVFVGFPLVGVLAYFFPGQPTGSTGAR